MLDPLLTIALLPYIALAITSIVVGAVKRSSIALTIGIASVGFAAAATILSVTGPILVATFFSPVPEGVLFVRNSPVFVFTELAAFFLQWAVLVVGLVIGIRRPRRPKRVDSAAESIQPYHL